MARNSELIEGCAYYHCIFTLPFELNDLIHENQKLLYNLMFSCVSDTLLTLCRDKKYMGATPGIIMVHTWGQKLNFHPHIHYDKQVIMTSILRNASKIPVFLSNLLT